VLTPILATKLYIPAPRPKFVPRPRLIERLNEGLRSGGQLTLISAAAGFGKTSLLSEWVAGAGRPAAWLSLDEGDNDPARFLAYLIAALQSIASQQGIPGTNGEGVLRVLQAPQHPPIDSIVTALLNEITTIPGDFILVLDDYHLVDAKPVELGLAYLIEHLPPQMHLVIATREDPPMPLARMRARHRLAELRAADLRFSAAESAEFLNRVMGLNLSTADIAALEDRTEGWIAGLQLAALSMQGQQDTAGFIQAFTGSHHFVLDYLVEEVLHQQPENIQSFLLRTSILDRLCGPLCDAVMLEPPGSGQAILESIERANLFIVPLDDERRWYRYHHLFGDLLRQRLPQSLAGSNGDAAGGVNALHIRASQWFEDNDLDIEAFHHAAAANDIDRAERLIDGRGIPLHLRGAVTAILDWLGSLPRAVLDARPSLWWRYGSMMLVVGQTIGVDEKLQAAEDGLGLRDAELDDKNRRLVGRIATARAVLALTRYQADVMLAQSRRALEYLEPNNLALRANANWTMAFGYLVQGDRAAARRALMEAIALSQAAGDIYTTILATVGLGTAEEGDNRLDLAAAIYRRVLALAGDQPLQIIYEAHLGLGRVLYEWNDLDAAEQHGQKALHLARQYESVIDRFIVCEVFLARLRLARGDADGAATILAQADQSARQRNFVFRIPEVAAAQVVVLLRQGKPAAAATLAQAHELPLSQARVLLAQGDPAAAQAKLEPWRRMVEARAWHDERLKELVLEALAHQVEGEHGQALQALGEALALAEPGGYIRIFVDEGPPMAQLLAAAAAEGTMPGYTGKLLAAFEAEKADGAAKTASPPQAQPLIEPLSQREIEVLKLMASGLSNREICERLFVALSTVKGHNQKIFDKLQVQRRTEAVARARELGLL
jgi:LuxR family maltose regulon positive regulatory protein